MRRYSPSGYSPPRRVYDDSPPRRGYGDSPPRRGYEDSPPRRVYEDSPPRRGYGGRERSPPRRRYGGGGGGRGGGYDRSKGRGNGSLLVRNIPLSCRPEELRIPFERFGPVRDVYIPKDYYTGSPRGFAFVEFVDAYDATEAQRSLNGRIFAGRELSVVLAADSRKRPEEMRSRDRSRLPSRDGGRSSSYHGGSRSRPISRSPSPRRPSGSRSRYRSRSYSPPPRRSGDYSVSPVRDHEDYSRGTRDRVRKPTSPTYDGKVGNGYDDRNGNVYIEKAGYDLEEKEGHLRSPPPGKRLKGSSRSPSRSRSRSRSRSADILPTRSRSMSR